MTDLIADAVQPEAWWKDLPRPQYKTLTKVEQLEKWFDVYKLDNDIFAIYEPGHFQEVISFLVLGSESALLIDTGMGIGSMKTVTDTLTNLPITVVNTHSHFDHIGGNHQYEEVHILNHPAALRRMKEGLTVEEVADNMKPGSNAIDYPEGFDPDSYHIKPCNFVAIEDGHVFDLGNRQLKVIATPGHSPDSVMFVDAENEILFTGDTFYPATLYAHLDSPDGLKSIVSTYRDTMAALAKEYGGYTLHCSHNEPVRPGSLLQAVTDAFDEIAKGELPYQLDESGLKKFTFDGFCIVTK